MLRLGGGQINQGDGQVSGHRVLDATGFRLVSWPINLCPPFTPSLVQPAPNRTPMCQPFRKAGVAASH